jgi:hypothetical protein
MTDTSKLHKNEDEYFARQDAEWIKARRASLDSARAAQETDRSMRCPRCGSALAEAEFHNVKIDRCKSCGGAWFDAGELEMVMGGGEGSAARVIRDLLGLRLR